MSERLEFDGRVLRLLQEGERFSLHTHVNPDGDGLGSQMALGAFLRSRGKRVRMINQDPVPPSYRFLALASDVETYRAGEATEFIESADGVIVLDNGSLARLGSLEEPIRGSRGRTICVDHHETRDDGWDLLVVDADASASGEIVHELIRTLGGEITPPIAEALYVSIITDTGHFRFSKTRPLSHRIAAGLLQAGVRPEQVFEQVYETNAEGYIRLMGHALEEMTLAAGGVLAWIALDRSVQERFRAMDEDTGGIVNTLLSMKGVQVALLLRELMDGQVKVSLRSKGRFDVHGLARRHGGGGHRHASGILLQGPLEAVTRRLVDEARALIEE